MESWSSIAPESSHSEEDPSGDCRNTPPRATWGSARKTRPVQGGDRVSTEKVPQSRVALRTVDGGRRCGTAIKKSQKPRGNRGLVSRVARGEPGRCYVKSPRLFPIVSTREDPTSPGRPSRGTRAGVRRSVARSTWISRVGDRDGILSARGRGQRRLRTYPSVVNLNRTSHQSPPSRRVRGFARTGGKTPSEESGSNGAAGERAVH